MKKHWWIFALLLLLLCYAVKQAEKSIATAVAIAATAGVILSYVWLWPIALLAWLLHFLWGSDTLRKLFGVTPQDTQTLTPVTSPTE